MMSIIAAIGKNRVIGSGIKIPWHLPADFDYFKSKTLGHPVIMGKKTYDSMGKPLPGRINIILTKETISPIEGCDKCIVENSLGDAVVTAKKEVDTNGELFVIGGGNVYAQAIGLADKLYITFVDGEFTGDVFFPEIDEKVWHETSRERREKDAENNYAMDFVVFERNK